MKDRIILGGIVLCNAFTAGGLVFGQVPVVYMQAPTVNISRKHGDLREAQSYIVQAFQKANRARRANQDQLGGHAQRPRAFWRRMPS